MNDNFYTLQQVLEIIRYELIGASANVVWVGQSIFAIGAIIYLAKLSYEGMLGSSLFSTKVLRVFGIAILLTLYPQFMLVIDSVMMAVNNSLGATYIDGDYRITDILKTRDLNPETDNDDNLIAIEDIHAEEDEEAAGLVDQFTEAVSTSLDVTRWIGEKLYWAMMRMVEEILFRISQAMLMIINAIRVFFLVVLYVIGPLVLAASAFPGLESVFMKWLGRYLSVHLWLGIGNIFESIAVRLWKIIVENGGLWTSGIGLEGSVNSVILTSWSWIFLLTLIVGYITIPIIAGWVISGAGIGQAGALLVAGTAKHAARGAIISAKENLYPRYRN